MKPIAIVGAGPAGLTAAIAAARCGIPAIVYEQSPELRQIGAGFLLHSNGLRVLKKLGLAEAIQPSLQLTQRIVTDRSDGVNIMALDYEHLDIPENHGAVVLREDLRQVLFQAAQESADLRFGHRCEAISFDGINARLTFDNGFSMEHSAVLACDGVNSKIRSLVGWREHTIPADYVTFAGISEHHGDTGCAREVWTRDGQYIGICPLPEGRSFFYSKGFHGDDPKSLHYWLAKWKEENATAHQVLSSSDLSKLVRTEFRQLSVDSWFKQPVFLLGDAAHAMRPNLGQGANSSMVDALVLVQLLANYFDRPSDLQRIGRLYQDLRRPFVSKIQCFADMIDKIRDTRIHAVQSTRNYILQAFSKLGWTECFVMSLIAGYNPIESEYLT